MARKARSAFSREVSHHVRDLKMPVKQAVRVAYEEQRAGKKLGGSHKKRKK